MGSGGLYLDTRRAVFPVLVGATIALAPPCVAVSQAANAKASSLLCSDHPFLAPDISRGRNLSVSSATRDNTSTASTGYLPTAVSSANINPSVPSIIAFAVSVTSALVGDRKSTRLNSSHSQISY